MNLFFYFFVLFFLPSFSHYEVLYSYFVTTFRTFIIIYFSTIRIWTLISNIIMFCIVWEENIRRKVVDYWLWVSYLEVTVFIFWKQLILPAMLGLGLAKACYQPRDLTIPGILVVFLYLDLVNNSFIKLSPNYLF